MTGKISITIDTKDLIPHSEEDLLIRGVVRLRETTFEAFGRTYCVTSYNIETFYDSQITTALWIFEGGYHDIITIEGVPLISY